MFQVQIEYSPEISAKLELAFQNGYKWVDIDSERFVDLTDKNSIVQQRKDDEHAKRIVRRHEQHVVHPVTPKAHVKKPLDQPSPKPQAQAQQAKGFDPIFYNTVKQSLSKCKIDPAEKNLLRTLRRNCNVDEDQFFKLIASLGWTEIEWDQGYKKPDYDLEEERMLLQDPNAFEIIRIKPISKKKDEEALVAKVCWRFYNSVSNANAHGSYQIEEISLIVNSKSRRSYEETKQKFVNRELNETFGFYGTTRGEIEAIAKSNFKMGSGIYLAAISDSAAQRSKDHFSNQILICRIILGNSFFYQGRLNQCANMYDSQLGVNEIGIFDNRQILPLYIVTLK
jgi:hypothetical protein